MGESKIFLGSPLTSHYIIVGEEWETLTKLSYAPITPERIFNALRKENLELTEEKFKKQLATSVGPAQVLYCTAIDLGFRGSIDELRTIECNLDYAAKYRKAAQVRISK